MTTRRTFLKNASLLALSAPLLKSELFAAPFARKLPGMGIQLYMVKEDMEKDTPGTLAQIGKMCYTQIESYGGNKGVFWGMGNKDFSKLAKDNGLTLVSTHYAGDTAGYEKLAAEAAEIGMKYLIYPWKGPQKSIDDFKRIADEFNRCGAICKKNGLRFAYHPHDYPYKPVDGQLPIDVLLAGTDKDLVDFQMDFYYTVTEGQNPEAYIKKHAPRFRLCHMRDVLKVHLPKGSEEESACDLGTGIINYPHLLKTGLDNGMEYFFVEQSRFFHETPLQSAAVNAAWLKKLKLT
ncbi:sugar phosphate isomerase/epimerase family protein [Mucilaginibacter flavidus]|uniref:sugar phosphate isomerase/epimerase family protein n=1 Tax=Mucilaginibacter flavidus TaxID=2949309 RepID=UPI00209243B2|nr:sugar phosphate isomerase/epimerase [Mucilaginibacter flavidus]MCO5947481.1 sugar phosphate isomerase/epimerase [Mucilaginibacter flavidus]